MPLRDDRRGRRATLGGSPQPFRPDFRAVVSPPVPLEARHDRTDDELELLPPATAVAGEPAAAPALSGETKAGFGTPVQAVRARPTVATQPVVPLRWLLGVLRGDAFRTASQHGNGRPHEPHGDLAAADVCPADVFAADVFAADVFAADVFAANRTAAGVAAADGGASSAPPALDGGAVDSEPEPGRRMLVRNRLRLLTSAFGRLVFPRTENDESPQRSDFGVIEPYESRAASHDSLVAAATVERSFAHELASFLTAGDAAGAPPTSFEPGEEPTRAEPTVPAPAPSGPTPPSLDLTRRAEPFFEPHSGAPRLAAVGSGGDEVRAGELPDTPPAVSDVLVVHAPRNSPDRVVPITRLPLRPCASDVIWPSSLDGNVAPRSRLERHRLLERIVLEGAPLAMLEQAYDEEDHEGRVLALRALATHHGPHAVPIFTRALQAGSDDERGVAIDALAEAGCREALVPAFGDRVDALVARAALAYVGTTVRADYVRALRPHLEAGRLETILTMLAGYVE